MGMFAISELGRTTVDTVRIGSGELKAWFAVRGAELVRLTYRDVDLLWHGDPVWWDFRAPLLFPVVGRSPENAIRIDGHEHPMPPHGFARDRIVAVDVANPDGATFSLRADDGSRRHYPFEFRLVVAATLDATTLKIATTVENAGDRPMPFQFGYHPGFVWPLPGAQRDRHVCRFEKAETAPTRRNDLPSGMLRPERFPAPLDGRTLTPTDKLFETGAVQFEKLASRRVWYGPADGRGLDIRFPDSPHLGVWTKPGAPFLCIEPWQGLAEVQGADGELARRPGTRILAPGERADYRLETSVDVADPGS
jgi:galactose mutarotase-like enzyme